MAPHTVQGARLCQEVSSSHIDFYKSYSLNIDERYSVCSSIPQPRFKPIDIENPKTSRYTIHGGFVKETLHCLSYFYRDGADFGHAEGCLGPRPGFPDGDPADSPPPRVDNSL
jgi:hypothetical protein